MSRFRFGHDDHPQRDRKGVVLAGLVILIAGPVMIGESGAPRSASIPISLAAVAVVMGLFFGLALVLPRVHSKQVVVSSDRVRIVRGRQGDDRPWWLFGVPDHGDPRRSAAAIRSIATDLEGPDHEG